MLLRRVRKRFNERLLCIGNSATMASEGSPGDRNAGVAPSQAAFSAQLLTPTTSFRRLYGPSPTVTRA